MRSTDHGLVMQYTDAEVLTIQAIQQREGFENVNDAIEYIKQHHPHLLPSVVELDVSNS